MKSPLNWMLLVPLAVVLEVMHADPLYIFITCALGIIPLAGWMGRATEWMAEHLGTGIGGLLNATFGNAAELIIALVGRGFVTCRASNPLPALRADLSQGERRLNADVRDGQVC